MRRARVAAAAALLVFAAAGCGGAMLSDSPDGAGGDPALLRAVNSGRKEERQTALRLLADKAGELRRAGRRREAVEIEQIIIRRYFVEKEQEVRAGIVRLAAPAVGRGSTAMVRFLRDRIAAGEFPGYAALSLASLGPKDAYADIAPLTRHPAPEVRYQAALALTLLGDARGYDAAAMVWRSMRNASWPDMVEGMTLEEARDSLQARAKRGFGRELQ
jgi:hypothetical protein